MRRRDSDMVQAEKWVCSLPWGLSLCNLVPDRVAEQLRPLSGSGQRASGLLNAAKG